VDISSTELIFLASLWGIYEALKFCYRKYQKEQEWEEICDKMRDALSKELDDEDKLNLVQNANNSDELIYELTCNWFKQSYESAQNIFKENPKELRSRIKCKAASEFEDYKKKL